MAPRVGGWWAAAASALVALACADTPGRPFGEWRGSIDTLPSGRLVVRNPDEPLWRDGEAWELRESFRIGAQEGDAPDLFGEVRDVELAAGGELYVLDAQASEVRVFGINGEHVRTFGRPGEGPGELLRPAGMALDAEGTVWVLNSGNGRYSGFDPHTGELRREVRRLASFITIPWSGRFDRRGRLLDIGLRSDGAPAILGLDSTFTPRDTLPLPRADERYQVTFRRGELTVMTTSDPFAPQPSWAPHVDGGIVVGEGHAYRLHRIDLADDTTMTIEVPRAPVPVTRAEGDSAAAAFAKLRDLTGGAAPDREPRIPQHKPAHGAIFVDDRDRIWVRTTPAAGAPPSWDVFGEDGRLLGQVEVPVARTSVPPAVRGERMALVTSLSGVPTVIVYDLIRPENPRGGTPGGAP